MIGCSGNHAFIYGSQMNEDRLTEVGAWARRRQSWGRKGAIRSSVVGKLAESPFVRCIEVRDYETKMSGLLEASCNAEVDASKLSLCVICYD